MCHQHEKKERIIDWGFKNCAGIRQKTNNKKAAADHLEDVEVEDNYQESDQEYYNIETSIEVRNDALFIIFRPICMLS
uniref:Uncharacterized protein n=1 Tax=Caenorhabditis japonica TaxID=281687 RepID=A0A8R1I995_CAEJA